MRVNGECVVQTQWCLMPVKTSKIHLGSKYVYFSDLICVFFYLTFSFDQITRINGLESINTDSQFMLLFVVGGICQNLTCWIIC